MGILGYLLNDAFLSNFITNEFLTVFGFISQNDKHVPSQLSSMVYNLESLIECLILYVIRDQSTDRKKEIMAVMGVLCIAL